MQMKVSCTIQLDGTLDVQMVSAALQQSRAKPVESEKMTINLGHVDLGQIDLLVQDGFYSNRTDLIRTAIRNQLDRHADAVKKAVTRQQLDLGLRRYGRDDLERVKAAGEMLHIHVLGLVVIADDVVAGARARHDRLDPRARRLAGAGRRQGGPARPHR